MVQPIGLILTTDNSIEVWFSFWFPIPLKSETFLCYSKRVVMCNIKSGCHVMVTTPPSLLRMLKGNKPLLSLSRCCHLVSWFCFHSLHCLFDWAILNPSFKNGRPGHFHHLFLIFSKKQYNFYNNWCEKMSNQYLVPGFKPTTSWIWVSSRPIFWIIIWSILYERTYYSYRLYLCLYNLWLENKNYQLDVVY